MREELRAGKKDRFSLRAYHHQTTGKLHWLQIVNRERSNFVPFLNKTAVLMGESESVAQPTPGTSCGTDRANPMIKEPPPQLRHGVLIQWSIQCSSGDVLFSQ